MDEALSTEYFDEDLKDGVCGVEIVLHIKKAHQTHLRMDIDRGSNTWA